VCSEIFPVGQNEDRRLCLKEFFQSVSQSFAGNGVALVCRNCGGLIAVDLIAGNPVWSLVELAGLVLIEQSTLNPADRRLVWG